MYNSYKLNIYAQIFDNDGAYAIYQINSNITVIPDLLNITSMIAYLISGQTSFISNQILSRGSFLTSIQELQKIASLLNQQSLSDTYGLILNGYSTIFPQKYGPLANYDGINSVDYDLIFS